VYREYQAQQYGVLLSALQLLQVVLFAVSGVCCVVVTALLDVYAGCAETDDGEGVEVDTFLSDL